MQAFVEDKTLGAKGLYPSEFTTPLTLPTPSHPVPSSSSSSGAGGPKFDPLNFEKALTYHLIYHHSVGIQINHLVLLPAYLLGLLLLCSGLSPYLAIGVASFFSLHSLKLSLPFGIFFSAAVIIPVLYGALCLRVVLQDSSFLSSLSSSSDPSSSSVSLLLTAGPEVSPPSLAVGFALLLSSLLLQVLGHAVFEELQPVPSFAHGFLLAPFLEYTLVVVRILTKTGMIYNKTPEIFQEAMYIRTQLMAMKTKGMEEDVD